MTTSRLTTPQWTPAEEAFIEKHWKTMSDEEIGERLSRSPKAVHNRRVRLGLTKRNGTRTWSLDEISTLEELWGSQPISSIARRLGRTGIAVQQKALSMGLFGQRAQGDMMSLSAVTDMLGLKNTKIVKTWIEEYGLKATRTHMISEKRLPGRKDDLRQYIIRMDHLMSWLEENQDRWDSRRVPPYGLGIEPQWLVQKRARDEKSTPLYRFWTDHEEQYLAMQIGRGIPYSQVAKDLSRSLKSVKSKGHELGLVSGGGFQKKTA